MQLSLARFLSSERTTSQGDSGVSVYSNILAIDLEYSFHLLRDCKSTGLSFHCFNLSISRDLKRRNCSGRLTENQNL